MIINKIKEYFDMSNYLKLFENHDDYEDFVDGGTMVLPNVSYCQQENEVHYNAASNHDYSLDYFTIIPLETCKVRFYSRSNASLTYSIDGGDTWSALTITSNSGGILDGTTIEVPAGTNVLWKGTNTGVGALGVFDTDESYLPIRVEGNIMSLLYGDNFQNQTSLEGKTSVFSSLFSEDAVTNVIDAGNLILPATTLASSCYAWMFYGCSNLVNAPELPATTLASNCYNHMFDGCTSLVNAPSELPATTLTSSCYESMFYGCTSLTSAPELPATTLANNCYNAMFQDCTSLTEVAIVPNGVKPVSASYCCSMYQNSNVPRSSDYDSVAYDGCGGGD